MIEGDLRLGSLNLVQCTGVGEEKQILVMSR